MSPINPINPINAVAYLGLGGNVGDRQGALEQALSLLVRRPGIHLLRLSSLYETEPVAAAGGWFFNSVAEIETSLRPDELLTTLGQVEGVCGRPRRRERGEARLVDLDLLLYGSRIIAEPHLQVPHPRMHLRRFVLIPLTELDPGLVHPGLGTRVSDLLAHLPQLPEVRMVTREWFVARAGERSVP
ncbi:MAG: 2-amino-4-hydroxy-6-hydroxymethyldihydropteridine diphosphokinase [Candidatus Methylomirabilales bacterium]